MGKSKSQFDLTYDWITCVDWIWLLEDFIWKHVIWFEFVTIFWQFKQITSFNKQCSRQVQPTQYAPARL